MDDNIAMLKQIDPEPEDNHTDTPIRKPAVVSEFTAQKLPDLKPANKVKEPEKIGTRFEDYRKRFKQERKNNPSNLA